MAQFGKSFNPNDKTSVTTNLHEAIPLTGTHGMFESVYDYPYLSSSANHIFDLAVGGAASFTGSYTQLGAAAKRKRLNVYNSMAQVLNGFNQNGVVRTFDENGDFTEGSKYTNVFFLNFSRLLYKDEVQKGTFNLTLLMSGAYKVLGARGPKTTLTYGDYGAANDYRINSPAGEYGVLYVTKQQGTTLTAAPTAPFATAFANTGSNGLSFAGLIFYQAGVVVLPISGTGINAAFPSVPQDSTKWDLYPQYSGTLWTGQIADLIASGSTDEIANNFRHRVHNMSFNNTTELNSSIYFCRAGHNEFNYSGNPSYLSSSKIVVKDNSTDTPVSYVTTIGLYSPQDELLAVAKLSEPLRKTPETEYVLRVRLDY